MTSQATQPKSGRGGYRPGSGRKVAAGQIPRPVLISVRVSVDVASYLRSQPRDTVERMSREKMVNQQPSQ